MVVPGGPNILNRGNENRWVQIFRDFQIKRAAVDVKARGGAEVECIIIYTLVVAS